MTIKTLSSREFNQNASEAKKAASKGPVFITDRGRPAYALLKIEEYYRLAGNKEISLLKVMDAIPCGAENAAFEFDPPRLAVKLRGADLS